MQNVCVPLYLVRCPDCGDNDVIRSMDDASPYVCPACQGAAKRVFTATNARVDDSENIGAERTDATSGFNLGLPGKTDSDGRYRPVHSSEVGSRRKIREYAKQSGLTPIDDGRYRTLR